MGDFRSLKVWEKAHRLALDVYRATSGFPAQEMYGLTSQMRRAGISIAANIAEGCGRNTDRELARFVRIASGSASELETLALLAHDLGFMDNTVHQSLSAEVNKEQLHRVDKPLAGPVQNRPHRRRDRPAPAAALWQRAGSLRG